MSFKYHMFGAIFPTEVRDGKLRIYIDNEYLEFAYPFLKEDYDYDTTLFGPSNIMVYLNNGKTQLVMRYDGTVALFDMDNVLCGFTHFNVDEISNSIKVVEKGSYQTTKTRYNWDYWASCLYSAMRLYTFDNQVYMLEASEVPVGMIIRPEDNLEYFADLLLGTEQHPVFKEPEDPMDPVYIESEEKYTIKGKQMQLVDRGIIL